MADHPTQPYELTASQAATLMADGALSAEELTRSCLERIAARDAEVRAWAFLDEGLALRRARELDKIRAAAGPMGPLHGLPIGVKDMIDTGDMPTTCNSPIYAERRPSADALGLRVLKASGAFALGKTDTVEFAAGGRKALTRHPMDPTRTPGGSSSGSGAAVGDKQVPLALGTQTAGSHIRPASFNGIYALKPTWGTLAWPGARQAAPTLDTLGWYGRSPDDLTLVARAARVWGIERQEPIGLKGLRVGLARTHNWDKAAPETVKAIERGASLLAAEGAEVDELALPDGFETLNEAQAIVMAWEKAAQFLPEYLDSHALLHPDFRRAVEAAPDLDPRAYCAALDHAASCRARFDALFGDDLDVVLTPSAVGEAPVGPETTTGDYVMNAMWTLLHMPCVNVPGAVGPNGLPVGVTLTGPRYGDARLLAIASAAAAALDPALTS